MPAEGESLSSGVPTCCSPLKQFLSRIFISRHSEPNRDNSKTNNADVDGITSLLAQFKLWDQLTLEKCENGDDGTALQKYILENQGLELFLCITIHFVRPLKLRSFYGQCNCLNINHISLREQRILYKKIKENVLFS